MGEKCRVKGKLSCTALSKTFSRYGIGLPERQTIGGSLATSMMQQKLSTRTYLCWNVRRICEIRSQSSVAVTRMSIQIHEVYLVSCRGRVSVFQRWFETLLQKQAVPQPSFPTITKRRNYMDSRHFMIIDESDWNRDSSDIERLSKPVSKTPVPKAVKK